MIKRYRILICMIMFNLICIKQSFSNTDLYNTFLDVEEQTRVEQAKFLSAFINTGSKPIETLEYLFKKEIPKKDKTWLKKVMGTQDIKSVISYSIGDTVYIKDSNSKLKIVKFVETYPHFILQVDDKIYYQDHSKENYKKLIEQIGNSNKNISFNQPSNFFYLSKFLLPDAEAFGWVAGILAAGIYGVGQSNTNSILKNGFDSVQTQLSDLNKAMAQLNQIQKEMVGYQKRMVDLQTQHNRLLMAQVDKSPVGMQAKKMATENFETELLNIFNPVLTTMQNNLTEDSNLSLLSCKERVKDKEDYSKISTKFSTDSNGLSITRNKLNDNKEKITIAFSVNGQMKNFDFISLKKNNSDPKFNPYDTEPDEKSPACVDSCSKNQTNLSLVLLQKNKTKPLDYNQIDKVREQLFQKKDELESKILSMDQDMNSNKCDVGNSLGQGYLGKLRDHFSSIISTDEKKADTQKKKRDAKEYCLKDYYRFLPAEEILKEEKYFQKKGQRLGSVTGWIQRQFTDETGPEYEILRNRCRYELLTYLNKNPITSDIRQDLWEIINCEEKQKQKKSSRGSVASDIADINNFISDLDLLKDNEKILNDAIKDGNNDLNISQSVNKVIATIESLKKSCQNLKIDCKSLSNQSEWTRSYMNDVLAVTKLGTISQLASACCSEPYCEMKLSKLYQDARSNRTYKTSHNN